MRITMITAAPSPTPVSSSRAAFGPAHDRTWQMLAAGDEVTLGDRETYRLIHLVDGRAWVSGLADGTNLLVAARQLSLVRATGCPALGRA